MTLLILLLFPLLLGAIYVFVTSTCDLIEYRLRDIRARNHFNKTEMYRNGIH